MITAKGRVDQDMLSKALYGRKCPCGGLLKIVVPEVDFSFKDKGQYERARKIAQQYSMFD